MDLENEPSTKENHSDKQTNEKVCAASKDDSKSNGKEDKVKITSENKIMD